MDRVEVVQKCTLFVGSKGASLKLPPRQETPSFVFFPHLALMWMGFPFLKLRTGHRGIPNERRARLCVGGHLHSGSTPAVQDRLHQPNHCDRLEGVPTFEV